MGIKLLPAAAPLLSQVTKLGSLLILFLLAPLLPPFLRVPYFYLLFNAIVLALGVQAGLLRGGSSAVRADDDVQHKSPPSEAAVAVPNSAAGAGSPFQRTESIKSSDRADGHETSAFGTDTNDEPIHHPKKITKNAVTMLLKKCPSRASIFFLCALDGGGRAGEEERVDEEEQVACKDVVDDDVVMSRQELFARTETFLGNFRRHLRDLLDARNPQAYSGRTLGRHGRLPVRDQDTPGLRKSLRFGKVESYSDTSPNRIRRPSVPI